MDNRQSNFDESTGQFVVASDNAVVNGVEVGRYLQTYSKGDLGPRFGFAYDVSGDGKTLVRGGFGVFWNFTPGGTSSSKAQNPPFLQATALNANPTAYGSNLLLKDGMPPPPGVDPSRPAAGNTRSIFDINFRDAYARQWNINVQRSLFTNYMLEVAYVGSQGRQMILKGDPNQAPPVVGVSDSNVNRPYAKISPALRTIGQVQSKGHARLQRPPREIPAAIRQQLLDAQLVHLRQGDRPQLRQRWQRHADQRVRPAVPIVGRPTTTSRTPSRRA